MATEVSTSTPPLLASARQADLYLVDAMGYVFRAYHALPRLSNSRGLPTHAVLGFANMLRKLLVEERPPYIAVVFDSTVPTFREQTYTEYKANRAPMPGDLAQQLPYIRKVSEAFRVAILEYPGYEADDVIGTIATRAARQRHATVIVSSDKDMLQLVNEHTCVLNPTRDNLLCDAAKVQELLGVTPDQVVDLLALRGDSIDNIPGAPGIGEKGARDLIQRFGTVENALQHAAEVERKTYRESLLNYREQILLSKELATIQIDTPVDFELEALRRQEPDVEACRKLFTELEFTRLLKESLSAASTQQELKLEVAHADATALEQFLNAHTTAAVSINATGDRVGLASDGAAIEIDHTLFARLAPALETPGRNWQAHDSKDLRSRLRSLGLPTPTHDPERLDDTQLYSYLLEPNQPTHTLDAIAERRFGQILSDDPAQCADLVARLAAALRPEIRNQGLWQVYADLDLPLIPVLERMQDAGVLVDIAQLEQLSTELDKQCASSQQEIFALAGEPFNLNSPKQLGDVLFGKLGLPLPQRRGKSKAPSTAIDVLEALAEEHAIVRHVLEYRQLSKLKSTYVDALPRLVDPKSGRVHTSFSQVVAATGRLASSNPNLQNIPIRTELGRKIRAAFIAPPGHTLLVADYSQIELRLLAHFSQDALLLEAFRSHEDIHRRTAAEVFGVPPEQINDEHRRRAKAVNFGIVYGLSPFGLSRQLGIPQAEAAQFIKRYFERYSGVRAYIDNALQQVRTEGRVRTLFGRVRPIPDISSRNPTLRGFAERTAINSPLQGTAADLMKLAMIRIDQTLRDSVAGAPIEALPQADAPIKAPPQANAPATAARLLLQVHDELVLEVPLPQLAATAELVRHQMEHVYPLSVPLVVDVCSGSNWRDLSDLE
jgi:DNA polymerase-1